jgi:hypothetical protein
LKNLLNVSPFDGNKKSKIGQAPGKKDALLLSPHLDLEETERRKMKQL